VPRNYLQYLNEPQSENEEIAVKNSILRDCPFGDDNWKDEIIKKFKLESTINPRGRPRKGD
jgi:putative transposase